MYSKVCTRLLNFIKWKIYLRKIFNLILAPSVCTGKANGQIRYSNKKLLHVYETMWRFQPHKNSKFWFLIIGQVRIKGVNTVPEAIPVWLPIRYILDIG